MLLFPSTTQSIKIIFLNDSRKEGFRGLFWLHGPMTTGPLTSFLRFLHTVLTTPPLVPSSPGLFLSARLACEMRAKAIRRLMQALKSELEA